MITVPREDYRDSLDELRADVESMGTAVLDQLSRSLDALETDDRGLAREVIAGDERVNRRYLDLESDCIDLIALQQPVASDLRFVAASFKILTDVERVGDLATNLARHALAARPDEIAEVRVREIGETARDQVRAALQAYVDADPAACRAIAERDDELDASCQHASETVVRELVASEPDRWEVEQLLDGVSRLLLTIRDLERVGDHAVNIAARTLYATDGDPELIY
ncbi:phosphate uptake regulator, PhoU [Halorubrum distributum JCM 9100]|uniref:Phosphate-specific transport system accessory protein PhoU n=3 Tax=Halorubrum distributum TaxID=29283 RepID=M0EHI0_9EURY|nr:MULTISPECIES: phosphate signaling complex protein PhoU [Halorubrum distributum group]ELZ46493.1 phosphate uptake regulator, PhoU [Halorubrum distributum JCM 9100]ELZ50562.1 phosphate uptake regulator, PhoU [Halorubrum distributum JCM 10118]MYL16951.1 phosphate signaling complex protein PhoU [Halorubrum terrestre]MYL66905.1 phosphate signaling complex protein PhoU [Halorubrum terrestre]